MSDDKNGSSHSNNRSWLEKIGQVFMGEPKDQDELLEILRDAAERQLLDTNSLNMIEGVLDIAKLRVRDIMIPRSQMIVIEEHKSLQEIVLQITNTVHSRFPVIGDNKDEVLGVLLAKDLLRFNFNENKSEFNIHQIIRPAIVVPESKRLDVLLQEFRLKRNHMAIVVDEYGGVTGLVTIEDVLEQIVGDIEDEYDIDNDQFIKLMRTNIYSINGLTPIEEFNDFFKATLEEKDVETIGGLVMRRFGHLPKRGETVEINDYVFKILRSDKRRIHLLEVNLKEK